MAEFPRLLEALGADPAAALVQAGVDAEVLRNPANLLPIATCGTLLAAGAAATSCPHIGLLLGCRADLASLGPVGQLMRHAPTLEHAIRDLAAHQPRDVQGAVTYLSRRDGTACWGYALCTAGLEATEQICEAALAFGAGILRELVGGAVQGVLIAHRPPDNPLPYRACFGVMPEFDAEQYALLFPEPLLDLPVIGARPALRSRLEALVARHRAVPAPGIAETVLCLLRARAISSEGSQEEVAAELSLHPRTLGRRLRAEGTSFRRLQGEARFLIARQLLAGTRLRVTDIAAALGYADQSAFTHAFRHWAGQAPGDWRAAADSPAERPPRFPG
ncbi:AraC family transcriptional regulator ligand-binding domain-containing protein [Dankookia sp. P2]|uniref:AraC family transcriptional regulator n=1 Tax=Dankookia sp. P2 TaxID=3423955 RepID=UPI003D666F5D